MPQCVEIEMENETLAKEMVKQCHIYDSLFTTAPLFASIIHAKHAL